MALDNYENFKAAIIRFAGRNDIKENVIDEAISITDASIYSNDSAPLKIRDMEKRSTSTLSAGDRFHALPDGFLRMRRLRASDCDVEFLAPAQMRIIDSSGVPRFFTVTSQLEFDRSSDSDQSLEMQYYARIPVISESNPTNTILTNHPNIYFFGVLSVVYQFAAEEEKAEYYYNKFIQAIAGANKADRRGRFGPNPQIKARGSTP